MARISKEQVERVIREAFAAYLADVGCRFTDPRRPSLPTTVATPEPRSIELLNRSHVQQARRDLQSRLKRISYPYPPPGTRRSFKSFYDHFQQRDLLRFVLSADFLEDVALSWLDRSTYDLKRRLRSKKLSLDDHPLKFYEEALQEHVRYLQQLSATATKHRVSVRHFSRECSAILKAVLREAAICYPQAPQSFKAASESAIPAAQRIADQIIVFGSAMDVFRFNRVTNAKRTAYQLTALVCSPPDSIEQGKLKPNPETVERNIRDYSD
jgi:hypothetical protein